MKTLKKQIVILALFFASSLAAQPLIPTPYIVLTDENLEEVAKKIVEDYGSGSKDFEMAVYDFLRDQLVGLESISSDCRHVEPAIVNADYGQSITFEWKASVTASANKERYLVNNFNLFTEDREHRTTTENRLVFEPLAPGFYIFSFITHCFDSGGISNPVIIIADKDIFLLPPILALGATSRNSIPSISHWQVSPNPFRQEIAINLESTQQQEMNILLYNINGRIIQKLETRTSIDPQTIFLSTAHLQSGFYTLLIQTADQCLQQKLVKL